MPFRRLAIAIGPAVWSAHIFTSLRIAPFFQASVVAWKVAPCPLTLHFVNGRSSDC